MVEMSIEENDEVIVAKRPIVLVALVLATGTCPAWPLMWK